MAYYRQIHTKIWKDGWFLDLDAKEKLLFIYLFSNERTSVSGIYDLPLRVMAFETGINQKYVEAALKRFDGAGKIRYRDGVVWVRNLKRYNATSSIKVLERIRRDLEELSDCELKREYVKEHGVPKRQKAISPPGPPPELKREGRAPGSRSAQTQVRKRLVEERGRACEECGEAGEVTLHHKIPVRTGGTLDDDNCILLCANCHKIADADNRKRYPIRDSEIPYPQSATEHEHEHEQEHEHEHEQEIEQESKQKEKTPTAAIAPPSEPKSKRKTSKAKKPPTPEAVKVFRENAHRYPVKAWYSDIAEAVGEKPANLELWGRIVKAYVGCGWNPGNVKNMLDFYERREIPTTKGQQAKGNTRNGPDEWLARRQEAGMGGAS